MSDTPIKPSADEIANLADRGRDVAGYAVEMYFDPAGERQIGNLIDQLSSRGIRSSRPAASRPHVSLAVFDQVDLERMSVALRKFARECSALRLYLASIGRFPSDEGVVFLAPVVHRELLELHAKLHRMPSVVAGTRREYYLAGRWVPHCTIAEGLTPADICITLKLARNSRACREVSIHEIGLVQLGPHRVIAVYPVGNHRTRA